MMELSIVMPMFNEEQVISQNVQKVICAFDPQGISWEIILVNDGSTDGSLKIAKTEAERFSQLRIISYDANRGRGYALRKGIEAARGKLIITTESDLTWGVEALLKIFKGLQESEDDVIVASPYCSGGRVENVPLKRALLSRIGNRVLGFTFSGKVTMVSGMTRGYRREIFEAMELESNGKEIHLEILSKAQALGFRISEVPAILRWERGKSGRWKGSQRRTRKLIISHLLFSFGELPFLLFGTVGSFFLLLGASFGIYAYFLSLSGIHMAGRPMILVATLLILFGFQILAFCFLANQNRDLRNALIRMNRHLVKQDRQREKEEVFS